MLLRWGCEMADNDKLSYFVMASPSGLPLHSKLGFEAVGEVRTEHVTFTSMFQERR
jgi:hypothetical protein